MHLLYEEAQMEKILHDYHTLLGVSIGIYDKDNNPIYLIPKKTWNFCNIVKQSPEAHKNCTNCDIKAFEHVKKTKELYIYRCHMGLYEAVAPIIDNQNIIGYIMVGQLLDEDPITTQWTKINRICHGYNLAEEDYKEAFFSLKQMEKAKIETVANIIHGCSAYLILKNIVHIERSSLLDKIDNYLMDNIREPITQDSICSHLKISKSTLYNNLMKNRSLSLIPYLRLKRLEHAKLLLSNSDKSIKDIAEACGIFDYNYFSRLFKKTFNTTPRTYRADHINRGSAPIL